MSKSNNRATNEWHHILFVQHPELYLPELQKMRSDTEAEVMSITNILKEFEVHEGSRILDFSCGIGRHSVSLAQKGYEVIGYDPSQLFIKYAERNARDAGVKDHVRFFTGSAYDMEEILLSKTEYRFDATIILSNSLGYSDSSHDLNTFRQISNISQTKSLLITETENRDWRIRNFLPHVYYDYGNIQLYEKWEFDLETSTAWSLSKFFERKRGGILKLALEVPIKLRLYSLHELKDLLLESNWEYVRSFGNLKTLEKISTDSADIVTVSQRA